MFRAELDQVGVRELGQTGFALAVQMLRHQEDAADVVQDCLLRLVKKPRSFDATRGSIRPFFLKTVRNRCIDLLRQRKNRPGGSDSIQATQDETAIRPDESAERREMLEILRSEVDALPDEHREIILLRDFHNLSYAEISDVLSIRSGTVMSRLHRARAELGQRMQKYR